MSEHSEIVYSAGHIAEAILLKQLLDERGIESIIENQILQGAIGELPPGEATNPRVRVAAEDADKAREVVKSFEHQQRLARERSVIAEDGIDYVDEWSDWPTCPACQRRRQTVCPVCETAGTDLPLADPNHAGIAPTLGPQTDDGGGRPLLLCRTCDEPFRPRFYQVCQWCGHLYEDGIPPPPEDATPERLNPRVWAALAGIGMLLAALSFYFWWISR